MRRTILLLASMAVMLVLAAGAAFALLTANPGGSIFRVIAIGETAFTTTSSTSFVPTPNASVVVSIPSTNNSNDLIMARFSAESACHGGTGAQRCSIRIVARNLDTGAIRELQPAAGLDYAFDSTNNGSETFASWESHSMDRALRLAPGAYNVIVERAVSSSAVSFALDDYSLTVEQAT